MRYIILLFCGLLSAQFAQAQTDEIPRATRTLAIENAMIHVSPGVVLENGTIVFRDGLVLAVGSDVDVPYDADRVQGDSLHVYPGFIDGFSHTGFSKPKPDQSERPKDPGNPPNDRAGIQPDRMTSLEYNPAHSSVASLRKIGFTTSHTVPYGGMLPGSGAVVNLGSGTRGRQIVDADASMAFEFNGARRMYPATPMAMMAKFRQLFRESSRRSDVRSLTNPQPSQRIVSDEVYSAFGDVVATRKTVFAFADQALEMYRVSQLKRDLGLNLVVAGAKQAGIVSPDYWATVDGVLLTLDLPDDIAKKDSVSDSVKHDATFVVGNQERTEQERENLLARKRDAHDLFSSNAANLTEGGVAFGFAAHEVKAGDIRKNIRTMIEHGLSEDEALSALTINGAKILGLDDQLGTLEPGKIANAVVTIGSYFDEDTHVQHVIIDGVKFDYEKPDKDKKKSKDNGKEEDPEN